MMRREKRERKGSQDREHQKQKTTLDCEHCCFQSSGEKDSWKVKSLSGAL